MNDIKLEPASVADIPAFMQMEQSAENREFITPYNRQQHSRMINNNSARYLNIRFDNKHVGFILVAIDDTGMGVECRRIVVTKKGLGLGQRAMLELEQYVSQTLGLNRIWLDVFEHNQRGRHIYSKLGYRVFDQREHQGQTLMFMEKQLN